MSSPRDALTGSGALRSISTSIAPAMRAGGCTRARWTLGYYRQIAPELFAMSVGRSRPYEPAASFVLVNVEIGLARIPDARAGRFRRLSGVLGPGLWRTELVRYRNEELGARGTMRQFPPQTWLVVPQVRDTGHVVSSPHGYVQRVPRPATPVQMPSPGRSGRPHC